MSTTEILRTRCQRACGSSHSSQMRAVPRRFVAATRRAVLGGAIVVCALTTTGVLANPCFDEIGQLEEWERRLRLLSERAQQPAAARDYENLCHLDVDAMAAITQFQDALKKMGQCNTQSDAQLIARSRAIFIAYQRASAEHCERAKR